MTTAQSKIAEQRGEVIKLLECALTLAEDMKDGTTAYLIERAAEARYQRFTPKPWRGDNIR